MNPTKEAVDRVLGEIEAATIIDEARKREVWIWRALAAGLVVFLVVEWARG